MNDRLKNEAQEFSEQVAMKVSLVNGTLQVTLNLLNNILRIIKFAVVGLPIVGQAVNGFGYLWDAIISSIGINKDVGKWSRAINIVAGVGMAGLFIASMAYPPAGIIFMLTMMSVGYGQELWGFGAALVSRVRGSWKKQHNELTEKKEKFYHSLNELVKVEPELLESGKFSKFLTIGREINELEQKINQAKQTKNYHRPTLLSEEIELDRMKSEFFKSNSDIKKNIITLDSEIRTISQKLQERNAGITSKVSNLILGAASFAGVILLSTPLAPIGAAILLGTAICAFARIVDVFTQWSSRISNYSKKPESIEAIHQTLKATKKEIVSQHKDQPANILPKESEIKILKSLVKNDMQFPRVKNKVPADRLQKSYSDISHLRVAKNSFFHHPANDAQIHHGQPVTRVNRVCSMERNG